MATRTIHEIKQSVQTQLLSIPGVTGVGVGPKFRNCQRTGQLAIVVFVDRKLERDQVPAEHRIPDEIEGIKTDVVQAGRGTLDQDEEPAYVDKRRFRLGVAGAERGMRGGLQLSIELGDLTPFGTLGCIVFRDVPQGRLVFALTNAHVVNDIDSSNKKLTLKQQAERTGTEVGQPTPGGSDCSFCATDIIGKVAQARFDLLVDAAIIRLTHGLPWAADIEGIGPIRGRRTLTEADLMTDVVVRKRGRTTLVTRGVVRSINQAGVADAPKAPGARVYDGQIAVSPVPPFKTFSLGGDSGSVIVDRDRNVVSLHHTGVTITLVDVLVGFSISSPIAEVLSGFQVEIPTAATPDIVNTVPEVEVAGAGQAPTEMPHPASAVLTKAQADIERTEEGRRLLQMFRRHEAEVRHLITSQTRVAATWRRTKGGALGSRILSAVYYPTRPILGGYEPGVDGLTEVLDVLERYGTASLQKDLRQIRPILEHWACLSFTEVLHDLRARESNFQAEASNALLD